MIRYLGLLLLAGAALLRVTLQADFHHGSASALRIRLQLAGFHKTWQKNPLRMPGGIQSNRSTAFLQLLRRADKARAFLRRHVHLDRLDALLLLHTGDAARSALLSGAVQSAAASFFSLSHAAVRIRVLPDFFRGHSTLQARCIIHLRLGTILITAVLLCLAYLRLQQLTESEAA